MRPGDGFVALVAGVCFGVLFAAIVILALTQNV